MKNTFKRIGLIAIIVVIIGLTMTGCLSGTYTHSGNTANLTFENFEGRMETVVATISGATMTITNRDGDTTTLTRSGAGMGSNPFVGTWTGRSDGFDIGVTFLDDGSWTMFLR